VITDLPDKTEVQAFCHLTRKQAALYQAAVDELTEALHRAERAEDEGIQRKGMILSFLMRFKQICNHPSQWLGDHDWKETDSGKFIRLREIAEVIGRGKERILCSLNSVKPRTRLLIFLEKSSD
jgi:non-specific serine/threonine protein kinase